MLAAGRQLDGSVGETAPATEIDVGRRELKIAGDESIPFSKLVLTTVADFGGQTFETKQVWSLGADGTWQQFMTANYYRVK